ncbi:MAG: MarR family transcriptional regulator [Erysipelotrichaceae bacterium]|nr:MarR family transcriptional regulator [Erysipelotrichaceae bacterium]
MNLTLSYYVTRLHKDFYAYCKEELKDEGVTIGLMYFVLYIADHHGCKPSDMMKEMTLDKGYVKRSIDRLVEDGIITQTEHPTDRRATLLHVTEKGQRIYEKCRQVFQKWDEMVLADHSETERKALLDNLAQIAGQ